MPHILFDMDGTLLDTAEVCEQSLDSATSLHGLPKIPSELIREYFGVPGLVFLKTVGIPDAETVWKDWCLELRKLEDRIHPFAGMVPVLEKLQAANVPLGVITSRTADVAMADLKGLNLLRFFSDVVTAEDTIGHKPEPDPILCYLERHGVPAEECYYIGDTISDCECAHRAGAHFLLAGWWDNSRKGMEEEAVLLSPDEILTIAGIEA